MKTTEKYTFKFLIIISAIVVADFLIKLIIINTMDVFENVEVINGVFSILRIQTIKRTFGINWASNYWIVDIIKLTIQVLMLVLAIRIQKRNVNVLYKYATVMILCGWIGNYLDRIFLSQGNASYIHTDYIYFHFTGFVFNASQMVTSVGTLLLLIIGIIRFRDLKVIFSKPGTVFSFVV